jgi:mannose-1-phosphate guanylyltransferase
MLHVIIMAGGSGTRFWPASRRNRPKQLLSLATDTPLLRMTFERVAPLVPAERVWVVTTAKTANTTRELLPELPTQNTLAEPVGRNTAACAGFAAHAVLRHDQHATCVVLPADHIIGEESRFRSALLAGAELVSREGGLLTFGIRPTTPETGYGYLELGPEHGSQDDWKIHQLARFVEKPNVECARDYLASGKFMWNSGMFVWQAQEILDEIRRQLPELASGLDRLAKALPTHNADEILAEVYPTLYATSVDFGVMEGAQRCWVMPVDYPWSDIGSWSSLANALANDPAGNAVRGRVLAADATDNVLVSTGPVLSVAGVDGMVVVATPDATMVVPKADAQRVKDLVDALRARGWDDVL